jgi:uncharacterized protein YdeI (YjbR/CyaY-like superfamily)
VAGVNSSAAEPLFFATPGDFRAWLEVNSEGCREQWVGFHRKDSGRPSVTWPEAVDEALCVGWIDGLRKTVDSHSYKIRFTPRQAKSNWSAINIRRAQELTRQKRMRPSGIRAFASRAEEKSGVYSYENRHAAVLDKWDEKQFRASPEAWKFFQAQPQSYRKTAIWWVVSAKRAETRRRRLATLIAQSKANRRIS